MPGNGGAAEADSPGGAMSSKAGARSLVLAGTFIAPISQWFVFWLLARYGSVAQSGVFAALLAYSTPLFIAAGWGLRNSLITLRRNYSFALYLKLRILLLGAAALLLIGIGAWTQADPTMLWAVLVMKVTDGITDLLYGPLQRQQALAPYGLIMIANGLVSALMSVLMAALCTNASMIVFGSSVGSTVTMILAIIVLKRRPASEPAAGRTSESARALLRISAPIAFAQMLAVIITNIPTWTVAALGDNADVGRFAAAAYILTLGSLLGSSLNSMFIGEYQSIASDQGFQPLLHRLKQTTIRIGLVGILLSTLAFLIGPFLLESVYGHSFTFSPWLIAALTAAAILDPGTYVLNAGLLALNEYRNQFLVVAWSLTFTVVCILVCYLANAPALWAGTTAAATANATKIAFSALAIGRSRRHMGDAHPTTHSSRTNQSLIGGLTPLDD